MKRLLCAALPVVVLLAPVTGGKVLAGCASCGAGSAVLPYFTGPLDGGPVTGPVCGGWSQGWRYIRNLYGWDLIAVPPNLANFYPDGGFTHYDGEICSCFRAHSNYAPVNHMLPATASAQTVLERLRALNIPLVSPEPQFLNKNPRIAEGVRLPTPPPKMKKAEVDE
jgi:hypothetical protein